MRDVMVDNWFLDNVMLDVQDGSLNNSVHYAEFLPVIVLWDNVYYPYNEMNRWRNNSINLKKYLIPLSEANEENTKQIKID